MRARGAFNLELDPSSLLLLPLTPRLHVNVNRRRIGHSWAKTCQHLGRSIACVNITLFFRFFPHKPQRSTECQRDAAATPAVLGRAGYLELECDY